jgi:hypothetical protein
VNEHLITISFFGITVVVSRKGIFCNKGRGNFTINGIAKLIWNKVRKFSFCERVVLFTVNQQLTTVFILQISRAK